MRTIAAFAAIILLPWAGCSLSDRAYKSRLLPKKLHAGWYFAEAKCPYSDFLSYQGAWVSRIPDETISSITEEGLAFFADIEEPQNAADTQYFGGEWKETPDPRGYPAETLGLPGNLHCGLRSWSWPSGIKEALAQPGSYYRDRGTARGLYVIPRLGIIVASGSDR